PRLDQLREAARGDREEDVLEHGGSAAGHFVQRQGLRGGPLEARELRRPHGGEGLHREAGAAAVRLVSAGAQVLLTAAAEGKLAPKGAQTNEAARSWLI